MIREIKSWFRKVFTSVFKGSISDPSEVHSKGLSKREITRKARVCGTSADIKEREAHILHILNMYKKGSSDEGKSCYVLSSFTISASHSLHPQSSGINYSDPSSDVCVKVIILGKYSYPDIDITKSGTVCKDVLTGRLYDFDDWTIFYDYVPHIWVRFLVHEDRWNYSGYMSEGSSMLELSDKFLCCVPKDELRDIRLGELGI